MKQATEIKNCLAKFCQVSGMKVNDSKTRVFFSKNIGYHRREELCSELGFSVTPDLGKYLGVPLHHNRVSKDSYKHVVDKVRAKLSCWKANSLSLAGRATLVSSVTSTIPGYSMQTAFIPASTCDQIEKHNRDFLWGSSTNRKKIHLVAWDNICKPKNRGGLGLRHLKTQNCAYMMKLGWNLMKKKDELWAQVIRSKYKCGTDVIPTISMAKSGSNTWKGIKSIWQNVQESINIVNNDITWKHSGSGDFNLKSAYNFLSHNTNTSNHIWSKIWKSNTLQRCKVFMWTALQNRLLTNEMRYRRGLSSNDTCPWCRISPETTSHVLRECPSTKHLWLNILSPSSHQWFFNVDISTWFRRNLALKESNNREDWSGFFCTLCWLLWKRRNQRIFDTKDSSNDSLRCRADMVMQNLQVARAKLHGTRLDGALVQNNRAIWVPPYPGWIKLNTDGAASLGNMAASGGLLRDEHGHFIEGFLFRFPDAASSFQSEVQALILGFRMAWERGIKKLIVEVDAAEVIQSVMNSVNSNHPYINLITAAQDWMKADWEVELNLIPRNANKVADLLAKKALNSWPGYFPMVNAIQDVTAAIHEDLSLLSADNIMIT